MTDKTLFHAGQTVILCTPSHVHDSEPGATHPRMQP